MRLRRSIPARTSARRCASASVEEHEVAPLIYEAAGQSIAWLRQEETVSDVISRIVRQMHRSWDELHAIG